MSLYDTLRNMDDSKVPHHAMYFPQSGDQPETVIWAAMKMQRVTLEVDPTSGMENIVWHQPEELDTHNILQTDWLSLYPDILPDLGMTLRDWLFNVMIPQLRAPMLVDTDEKVIANSIFIGLVGHPLLRMMIPSPVREDMLRRVLPAVTPPAVSAFHDPVDYSGG